MVGYQEVTLKPGQFIFGRRKAASDLNLSERTIRTCLKALKNFKQLTIETTNKFSILSIVKWDIYQSNGLINDQQDDQQIVHPVTSKRPANDQQVTTNKNDKECIKNEKEIKPSSKDDGYSQEFLEFWKLYPRKTGKGGAYKAWKKIKEPKTTLTKIQIALIWQKKSDQWIRNNGQYIPHPSTYLNQCRWEDEQQDERDASESWIDG